MELYADLEALDTVLVMPTQCFPINSPAFPPRNPPMAVPTGPPKAVPIAAPRVPPIAEPTPAFFSVLASFSFELYSLWLIAPLLS